MRFLADLFEQAGFGAVMLLAVAVGVGAGALGYSLGEEAARTRRSGGDDS